LTHQPNSRAWLGLALLVLALAVAACAPATPAPAPTAAPAQPTAAVAGPPAGPPKAPTTVAPAGKKLDLPVGVDADGNFYRGDPKAPVKFIEFSDFQ
jgi:protein-disulfide isomerase